jgi:RHS repeat-associated protein
MCGLTLFPAMCGLTLFPETNTCVFSGGLSVQEYDTSGLTPNSLTLRNLQSESIRTDGYGGGVGGMVYSIRNGQIEASHSNHRGDVIANTDHTGALSWFARYEAYSKRFDEWGANLDRKRGNTKEEEEALELLNEGFRYRDLETGTFLTRDPIGYADGPNVYCYVHCNPITKFDALGLKAVLILANSERNEKQPVIVDEGKEESGVETPDKLTSSSGVLAFAKKDIKRFQTELGELEESGAMNEEIFAGLIKQGKISIDYMTIKPGHGLTYAKFKQLVAEELNSRIITAGTKQSMHEQVDKAMKELHGGYYNFLGVGVHGYSNDRGNGIAFGEEFSSENLLRDIVGKSAREVENFRLNRAKYNDAMCHRGGSRYQELLNFSYRGFETKEINGEKKFNSRSQASSNGVDFHTIQIKKEFRKAGMQ